MTVALTVPVLLGAVAVLQAALNRQIATQWGLGPAALVNMTLAIALAAGLTLLSLGRGTEAGLLRVHVDWGLVRWWWLLPGCFGFGLVVGLPWAVQKLGALSTFVAVVAAQMVTSTLWDHFVEGVPLSVPRVLGAALAVSSVVLVSWK